METLTLSAKPREIIGKKVKDLRKRGFLPAVLYGHKIKPTNLIISEKDFEKVYQKAKSSTLINLKIDNEPAKKVLIHDLQTHPVSDKLIHIDFYQVKMTEEIETEIPLKFIGEAKTVKELDGTLITNKDKIKVKCLPDKLVHEIEVDISNLKTFEDTIKVSDLKIPKDVEILEEPEEMVVSVIPPKTEEELKELEAPVEEKVEEIEEVKEEKPEEEKEKEPGGEPASAKATAGEPEKIPESISGQQKPEAPEK